MAHRPTSSGDTKGNHPYTTKKFWIDRLNWTEGPKVSDLQRKRILKLADLK